MEYRAALHRYALFCAASVFFLIYAGALVTSTGSGLAVPDWPLSFGTLFPEMTGGVFYEHGHRLVAGTVALLTFGLSTWIIRVETRTWIRRLGILASSLVVIQALLGGLTVLMKLPVAVSSMHALIAQAYMCSVVAIALMTGPTWIDYEQRRHSVSDVFHHDSYLSRWGIGICLLIYFQIGVGALVRHSGAGFAIPDFPLALGKIIPPFTSYLVSIHFLHRIIAFLLLALIPYFAARVLKYFPLEKFIRTPALMFISLISLQVVVGALIIWTHMAIIPTSAHVVIGALTLACSLILTMRLSLLEK